MDTSFAVCLSRLREECGFHSAYRFYHGNGGRRHFGFTYVHYLRIEKGKALPSADLFPLLLLALRLSPGESRCRDLQLSYLKSSLGSEKAFEALLAPLLCAHERPDGAANQAAMRWMKSQHAVHLSPEQFRVIARDAETYWCSELLFNDRGTWSPAELAAELQADVEAVRAALKDLQAAGLLKRTPAGKYRSRWPGKFFTFPGRLGAMAAPFKAVRGYWDQMERKRGAPCGERVELVRAEDSAMRSYLSALGESVEAANGYATQTKGAKTGLYLIEARVRRLTDF